MVFSLSRGLKRAFRGRDVSSRVSHYDGWLNHVRQNTEGGSSYDHTETVNNYYDLCSEFMTWGWNESLHFASLSPQESVEESIVRHQRLMIEKLQLRAGMKVVDVGCGMGGPMRRVAREAQVKVLLINNNEQQLERAKQINKESNIDHMAEYLKCNFMDMSAIEAESFDAGYAIESTCHAPDKQKAFAEIFRVLKPGATFWGQEMCLTDEFDPQNKQHLETKDALMQGIALFDIFSFGRVQEALKGAGFDVIEAFDRGSSEFSTTPWYRPMETGHGTTGGNFRRTPIGRMAVLGAARLAEAIRYFPEGSSDVIQLMERTANAYVAGGRQGIFTPLYCFLARKPGA